MKTSIFLPVFVVFFSMLQAQQIDQQRMDRDLEVAKNVLSAMLSNSKAYFMQGFRNESVKAFYIEDYGVIFSLDAFMFRFAFAPMAPKSDDDVEITTKAKSVIVSSDNYNDNRESEQFLLEDKVKSFLVDYGHLIGQLSPDQHIMVKWSDGSGPLFLFSENTVLVGGHTNLQSYGKKGMQFTAEVQIQDIQDFQQARLSRDAAMKKIKIEKSDMKHEKVADLELLASMFQRLYAQDLSETYYSAANINYQKLSGVGVIFQMKVFSSIENEGLFQMPTINFSANSIKERNEKVMGMLPAFEKSFKENLVNYGRTVKSLSKDESIIFEVGMTQCKACPGFPSTMKFSVKFSTLQDYNLGKVSFDQALSAVRVEKKS